ncbi:DUF5634 family protein [Scopulibacillus cellulosilyticus]|uniref:DUF5634 family protein n=1 Tax=Scopulibacillus cellulosilyticus TaxID=2665665 RepID=A0ABW2Q2D3_9BACL
MEYVPRETVLNDMKSEMKNVMNNYGLEDIGLYEEEGEGREYYIGYTVRKDGKVYMINIPFVKNDKNELAIAEQCWMIQEENGDYKGCKTLGEVFQAINYLH